MQDARPIITLLTDFGHADAFVGTMKGVLLSIAPQAQLVDLSHLIPPQDVKQAAFILMTATPFFPDGTVHLVVVDPGVGSMRRPIAVETPRTRFVAPDNGVLSYALAQAGTYTMHELANPTYRLPEVSTTFHGRDIFSPAAAHLAAGVPLHKLGPPVETLVQLDPPRLEIEGNRIEAEVLNVDRFGNIRTSVHTLAWVDPLTLTLRPLFGFPSADTEARRFAASRARVFVSSIRVDGISATFSDVGTGKLLAYVGSEGGLEIAVNQGNAAREFGVKPGDAVSLHLSL